MDSNQLKEKINKLTIWKSGAKRAPHKPLLILYALGQLQKSSARFLKYEELRAPLVNLLREFGPQRDTDNPHDPFLRLVRDGIWMLNSDTEHIEYTQTWLRKHDVSGGFNDEVYSLLQNNPSLLREVALLVLNLHFPETIHQDILAAVGLDLDARAFDSTVYTTRRSRIRDPRFREKILQAYDHSCAVCGFNVRLGKTVIALEAAHIKWHQAGGPDREDNGLALCAMHHKLFDLGAFTINDSREFLVAKDASGTNGYTEWLMRYHRQPVRSPINSEYQPNHIYVNWHFQEVFKGSSGYHAV